MSRARLLLLVCLVMLAVGSLIPSSKDIGLIEVPVVALAQAKSCPDVVKAALATANQKCTATGRNKACYGNTALTAEAQPGAANFTFSKPGDITNLNTLRTIKLSALDATANTWGIVLLRVQANLPDTAAGQNATLLMFGDVGLTGDSTQAASILTGQQATGSATAQATGAATVQAPAPAVPAATASAATSTKPLQAFYFRTGVGDPACDTAPRDGILVQSPQGSKQKVTLSADGVKLELGSTAFLEAQAGVEMKVSTLEGSVAVTALGTTETATAGTRVRVPLDANLNASGTPTPPETYDYGTMLALPVHNLPQAVTIVAPAPPANAQATQWKTALNVTSVSSGGCATGGGTATASVKTSADGKTIWLSGPTGTFIFSSSGRDNFSAVITQTGITTHYTMHFASPTHADGDGTFTGFCSGSLHFTLDRSNP